jgi:hypothetical protein
MYFDLECGSWMQWALEAEVEFEVSFCSVGALVFFLGGEFLDRQTGRVSRCVGGGRG